MDFREEDCRSKEWSWLLYFPSQQIKDDTMNMIHTVDVNIEKVVGVVPARFSTVKLFPPPLFTLYSLKQNRSVLPMLPNQVHFAQHTSKTKHWAAEVCSKEGLFVSQSIEETGELVSDLPPQRQGDWAIWDNKEAGWSREWEVLGAWRAVIGKRHTNHCSAQA